MTRLEADWLTAPAVVAVMTALGEGYFVGGCVRNVLLGVPASDIDIATPLTPERVVERLEAGGLRAVPTGIDHGTITAVAHGQGIEVTTFRADVETDGRRAVVRFTTSMAEDAVRRDFTMNALYADADGEVIDPLDGLPDLRARRVRFIEDAEARIREDYLRILRFFRFHAWYGAGGLDAEGLAACTLLSGGVERLARERIGQEFRKLLVAPDPAPALAAMQATGVLRHCLPDADTRILPVLIHLEEEYGHSPDWPGRLAAINLAEMLAGRHRPLVDHLRLSKAEARVMERLSEALRAQDRPHAQIAYRYGRQAAWTAALIQGAALSTHLPATVSAEIERGAAAVFPLAARDLLDAGMPPGPTLGAALSSSETIWLESDFSVDKAALLKEVLKYRS